MKEFLKLKWLYEEYLEWKKKKPKPDRKEYFRQRYIARKFYETWTPQHPDKSKED